ncbi:hypothetical protein [Colwellia piezophila]|nr:hypothetical protein [Colwellia piezophila]
MSNLKFFSIIIVVAVIASATTGYFVHTKEAKNSKRKANLELARIINSYSLENCGNQYGLGNYKTPQFKKCYNDSTKWFQSKVMGYTVVHLADGS